MAAFLRPFLELKLSLGFVLLSKVCPCLITFNPKGCRLLILKVTHHGTGHFKFTCIVIEIPCEAVSFQVELKCLQYFTDLKG
jgi:hypothetical protein